MVNVKPITFGVSCIGCCNNAEVKAAAAGEDNLSALGVPAGHLCLQVVGGPEGAAVVVLDVDINAHLGSCCVSTLHEAVAVTDNSGNVHAAAEAKLGITVFNCRIACQIAGLLFLIKYAVNVLLCVIGGVVGCVGFAVDDEVTLG